MIQLRRTAANAAAFNMECELLSPEQALEHYPVMRVDDLVGAIWLPADGKANPTDLTFALAKGARMRGARIVEKTRVIGILTPRRPGHRGAHRRGRRRGGDRRQLRRAVGETGRRDGGSQRAAAFGRALLRGHRGHRRRAPRPADPARPRRLHLLQGGSRRPGHRRLRAGGQAVGITGRHPVSVRIPAAGRGLGSLRDPDEQRPAADPRARGDRHQEVLQRSGELHPRQPVHPRRGARTRQLLRRRRIQLGGHRHRRAARAGRWPSGSSTAHPPATSPASTSAGSRRSTATTAGCTTASPRSSACTTKSPGPTGK